MQRIVQGFFAFVMGMISFAPLLSGITRADLLETAVQESKGYNQMIDIGNNKNAVWNTVFRSSIALVNGKLVTVQPLYIRVIKFILRATLVIGVSMGIILGIRYILAQGDSASEKKIVWYIWNIAFGVIIALSALVIVNLAQSITKSTLPL